MYYADAVRTLRSFHPFAVLDCAKLKLLAFSSAYLIFETGEMLFGDGEPSDSVYLIDEGEAELWTAVDGCETKVATFRGNELIDGTAMLHDTGRSSTILASGPLKVLKIDTDALLNMVADNPKAALAVIRGHRCSHAGR